MIAYQDIVVYAAPGGRDYVANIEPQGWVRWPAEQGGWGRRTPCPASLVDACEELAPRLGALALSLSGVYSRLGPLVLRRSGVVT